MDSPDNNFSPEPGLVKVSALQPSLRRFDRSYNIELINRMTEREADDEKPHFICLPNYFFQQGFDRADGPSLKSLKNTAFRHELYIVGGMALEGDNGERSNTGFVIEPTGNFIPLQRKLHLIPAETGKLQPGEGFFLLKTPHCAIGIVLCNDIFYPETARCMALMGAEIIFFPSLIGGLGVLGLGPAARTRAIENQVFAVNANGIPLETAETHLDLPMGHSGIYSPFLDQIDLASAGNKNETIRALLDLDELRELKKIHGPGGQNHSQLASGRGFNMLAGRRPELYGAIIN